MELESKLKKVLFLECIHLFQRSRWKMDARKKFECLICLENVPGKDTYALGCGHRYCKKCWKSYLEMKGLLFVIISTRLIASVTNEADCVNTHCPWPKCKEIVHDRAFKVRVFALFF